MGPRSPVPMARLSNSRMGVRISSYNVCYTKLLRAQQDAPPPLGHFQIFGPLLDGHASGDFPLPAFAQIKTLADTEPIVAVPDDGIAFQQTVERRNNFV